jgi:4-hydroxybenzoate polyprenyltransferase
MPETPATTPSRPPGAWLRLLRVHQWSKNLLLLVPPLGAHRFSPGVLGPALVGVAAFSLAASSAYVVNDLLDLEADRAHPLKSRRPLAARELAPRAALAVAATALLAAFTLALTAGPSFVGALGAYWMLTVAYSVRLKRVPVLDVLVLAGLYTLRILAGTLATGVPTSSWLFTLSIFLFLSLALVKRTSELRRMSALSPSPRASGERAGERGGQTGGDLAARGRGYSTGDLEVLSMLGVASGLVAVLVLALYVASADVTRLYGHHERLWLLCPLALYWVSRLWLLARRGAVDEDPVLFALRDPPSWLVGALAAAVVVAGS